MNKILRLNLLNAVEGVLIGAAASTQRQIWPFQYLNEKSLVQRVMLRWFILFLIEKFPARRQGLGARTGQLEAGVRGLAAGF
jgi:hypothetical protein